MLSYLDGAWRIEGLAIEIEYRNRQIEQYLKLLKHF